MPTVLSRMAMQLKKTAWIIPVFMVSGCSLSPAIPVIGAYYPSWFFCAIASLILTLITRRIIQRANINLAFVGIIYTALFCSLRHAALAGIFLIYLRRAHGKYAEKAPRSKFPALLVVALALVALVFVIWRVDSAPSTNDAYASADTIDVVPEVSGRIVELAVTDNQAVKQGDLLFRIDPRPYEANLAKAEASLAALDKQIMLTQRSVDAQQFGADSVNATVEKARAAAKQATDTLRRTEPLLKEGFVSAEDVDRARTAQRAAEADLNAVLLQAQSAASAVSGVDALVAQRAAVEADIALTKLHLEMATVRAPFDGRVISLKTSVGQFASAMRPIFTLIDTRHWYVIANFRETDLKIFAQVHPQRFA